MNAVNELCNLYDYIKTNFDGAEFISAHTPERSTWNHNVIEVKFKFEGRQYSFELSDETKEAKDEDNK